jgi:hypothetical protein
MSKIGDQYTEIERLAKLNSQDQHGMGYMPLYSSLFEPIRFDNLNILEIGFSRGRGCRTLAEYFHRSNIHSWELDYDAALPYYDRLPESHKERIKIHRMDQSDKGQIQAFLRLKGCNLFHLIIDDGSHNPEHQMKSWAHLWNNLAPGGYYIIEDMHPSYANGKHPTLEHFKSLVDEINLCGDIKTGKVNPTGIDWIMFPFNRIVMRKK